jgi:hypothetical protein
MHEVPTVGEVGTVHGDGIGLSSPGTPISRTEASRRVRRSVRRSSTSSCYNKWYFDELYQLPVRRARHLARPRVLEDRRSLASSTASARTAPPGWSPRAAAPPRKVQSGYLYSYALVMLLGLVGAISWVMVG